MEKNINSVVSEEKLAQLKKDVEKFKRLRIEANTRLEGLNRQKVEIEQEIRDMGYDPATTDKDLAQMVEEMEQILDDIECLRPQL